MPAVTAVALDSLLERGTGGGGGLYDSQNRRHQGRDGSGSGNRGVARTEVRKPSPSVYRISPALYATPSPAQIPSSSPTAISPSPYVLNHKRRDFRPPVAPPAPSDASKRLGGFEVASGDRGDGAEITEESERERNGMVEEKVEVVEVEVEEEKLTPLNDAARCMVLANGGVDSGLEKGEDMDGDLDDFFNPRDSLSVMSSSDTEEGGSSHCHGPAKSTAMLSVSEFYDATDDFFFDGSNSLASPLHSKIEADLRSLRLNLFEEIERRKKAEDSLTHMQNQWKKIASYLSELGLSFPPIPDGVCMQHETDSIMQLFQEIVVARFVSGALERGITRAEAEEASQTVIESKNHEIGRLHDRLQYYEAVNREMSQRNQEAIELARRQRQKRRMRQRWIWGSIGLSITVGVSLLAYTFIPQAGRGPQISSESDQCAELSTQ